jgi:hypothetical protein
LTVMAGGGVSGWGIGNSTFGARRQLRHSEYAFIDTWPITNERGSSIEGDARGEALGSGETSRMLRSDDTEADWAEVASVDQTDARWCIARPVIWADAEERERLRRLRDEFRPGRTSHDPAELTRPKACPEQKRSGGTKASRHEIDKRLTHQNVIGSADDSPNALTQPA